MSKITYVDNDTNNKLHITHEEIDGVNELQWPKEGVIATLDDLGEGVVAKAGFINKPTFVSPSNGSIDFTGAITLSPYSSTINYKGSLTSILVEIATDANFTTIISTQTFSNASNSINLNISNSNTMLYVRVKHVSDIHKSDWSDTLTVTTKTFGINIPSVLFPVANSTDVSLTPIITTSAFSYFGEANAHTGTTYQISTDELFTDIIYNVSNTDLTSHLVATELPDLKTDLYIRVKHTGSIYGDSGWSTVIKFTTLNVLNKMKILDSTLDNEINFSLIWNVTEDIDGNFIICGGINQSSTGIQPYIAKVDRKLNLLKSKSLSNTGVVNIGYITQTIVTEQNEYIMTGTYGPANDNGMVVIKTDTDLNIIAIKKIGNSVSINEFGSSLTLDKNGSVLVCGGIYKDNYGWNGAVIKLDSNLNIVNFKAIAYNNFDVIFSGIKVDSTNNIFIVGKCFTGNSTNGYDASIFKLDNDFNIIKTIGLSSSFGTNADEHFQNLVLDSDDNIYAVGSTYKNDSTAYSALIAKFDKNLNLLKSKSFNNSLDTRGEMFYSVALFGNKIVVGGVISTLTSEADPFIVEMDTDLNITIMKAFNSYGISSSYTLKSFFASILETNNSLLIGGRYTDSIKGTCPMLLMVENLESLNNGSYGVLTIYTPTPTISSVAPTLTNITSLSITVMNPTVSIPTPIVSVPVLSITEIIL